MKTKPVHKAKCFLQKLERSLEASQVGDTNHQTPASVDLARGITKGAEKMTADVQVIPKSTLMKSGRTTEDA